MPTSGLRPATHLVVQAGKCYLTRDNRAVKLRENTEGWLDKLPFVAEDIFGRQYPLFTCDERGWIYPSTPDLFGNRIYDAWDLVAEIEIKEML